MTDTEMRFEAETDNLKKKEKSVTYKNINLSNHYLQHK